MRIAHHLRPHAVCLSACYESHEEMLRQLTELERMSRADSVMLNGSLECDQSRGIAFITYDLSGNPRKTYFTNGNVTEYVYSASGQKLRVKHYTAVPNITRPLGVQPPELTAGQILHTDVTDYLLGGRVTMRDGRVDKVLFEGGYCQAAQAGSSTDSFAFYYYNQDHLGNIREVVDATGTVRQVTNYYPFGTPYCDSPSAQSPDLQPYKYNGKELDRMHGLDTYDYGARQYDPVLCRWDWMDPLCEKYYGVSPYVYCAGNPVNAIDPDGRIIRNSKGQIVYVSSHKYKLASHPSGSQSVLEQGYIFTDNGQPIEVYNNMERANKGWDTDCHGLTFADGKYWINNNQVKFILKGDGYSEIDLEQAKSNDIVIYHENNNVVHSVTIIDSDGTEDGTNVNGLGGLETEAHNDNIRNGWRSNGDASFSIFRKGHTDKVVSEKEIKDLRQKILKNEENENNK